MKKVTCIIGSVCIGMFLAFGQTADTAAEPPDTGPRLEAADTETPAQTADNAVDTAGQTAANPANTDRSNFEFSKNRQIRKKPLLNIINMAE